MGLVSTKIKNIVNEINKKYYLPAIQREFVWSTDQIETLFDFSHARISNKYFSFLGSKK
jgi:uncharacterized protein with ParB-like and HNH nuclease domain